MSSLPTKLPLSMALFKRIQNPFLPETATSDEIRTCIYNHLDEYYRLRNYEARIIKLPRWLIDLIELKASFPKGLIEKVLSTLEPAIHFKTGKEDNHDLGTSRFEGLPDLPAGSIWPEGPDEYGAMRFVAQFRLEEIRHCDVNHYLPDKGLFSFFLNLDSPPHPGREYLNHLKIIYTENCDNLVRLPCPDSMNPNYRPEDHGKELIPQIKWMIPSVDYPALMEMGINPSYEDHKWTDINVTREWIRDFLSVGSDTPIQLFGWANGLYEQEQCKHVRLDCVHADLELEEKDYSNNYQKYYSELREWRCLFELEDYSGQRAVFIRNDHLKSRIFETCFAHWSVS